MGISCTSGSMCRSRTKSRPATARRSCEPGRDHSQLPLAALDARQGASAVKLSHWDKVGAWAAGSGWSRLRYGHATGRVIRRYYGPAVTLPLASRLAPFVDVDQRRYYHGNPDDPCQLPPPRPQRQRQYNSTDDDDDLHQIPRCRLVNARGPPRWPDCSRFRSTPAADEVLLREEPPSLARLVKC